MNYEQYVKMMNDNMEEFKKTFSEKGLAFYPVSRLEVEKKDFSGIKEVIKVLEKKKKKAFGSFMITFSGYDDTAEEVFEVPDVRKWVEEVFKFCPHFLYFVSFEMECQKWIVPCICNDVQTFMPKEARKTENEWFKEGKLTAYDRPQMVIKQKMDKEMLNSLVTGLKMYGSKVNDQARAAELIHYLKWHFSKDDEQ